MSLFLGIFFGRSAFFPDYIAFLSGIFLAIAVVYRRFLWLVGGFFLLGNFYGQYRNITLFQDDILPSFYDQSLEITGWVENFPDQREKNNRVFLSITKIARGDEVFQDEFLGRALLITPPETPIDYGDRLRIRGKIYKPKKFEGFDYPAYLRRFGIRGIVKHASEIETLSHGTEGYRFVYWAKQFRNVLAQNLSETLPSPHDQIAMGILLGVKKQLPEDVAQHFKNSGLQHILVVSGFNVTVLLVFCALVLRRFGRRIVFAGSVVVLFFFLLMVGGDPPVLRATVFGGIVAWAVVSGRLSDSRNLLFLTAVLLALISPAMVQRDVGFFLSFLATLGIVLALPIFQKVFAFLPEKYEFRSIVSVIVAAQLSVFPILSLYFGSFPAMGFLSNIFVEPLIPIGMGLAFLTTIAYPFLGPTLILIFAFPARIILSTLLFLADLFGRSEGMAVPPFLAWGSLFLVLLFFIWGSFSLRYQRRFLEGD